MVAPAWDPHLSGSPYPYPTAAPRVKAVQTPPCNHRFLFGTQTKPGSGGGEMATPLAGGLLWSEGPEVKVAQPPGILEGWEPRQVEGGRQQS